MFKSLRCQTPFFWVYISIYIHSSPSTNDRTNLDLPGNEIFALIQSNYVIQESWWLTSRETQHSPSTKLSANSPGLLQWLPMCLPTSDISLMMICDLYARQSLFFSLGPKNCHPFQDTIQAWPPTPWSAHLMGIFWVWGRQPPEKLAVQNQKRETGKYAPASRMGRDKDRWVQGAWKGQRC